MMSVDNPITTMGKLFPDGAALDQLQGNCLVLRHNGLEQSGPTVDYDSRTYSFVTLDDYLAEIIYLPTGPFAADADRLVAELREELATVGLEDDATLLLATATLATWVVECTPGRILINICGDTGAETSVLDLLACLCRRTLRLAGPSLHDMARLPATLSPTLMINRPSQAALARLAAAGHPDTYWFSGGELRKVHCPIVASTCTPLTIPALIVPLLPSTRPVRRITRTEAQRIADRFQPRLLGFRLARHLSVANSQFDVPEFTSDARATARVLGATLEGSANLQQELTNVLRRQDEANRAEKSQTPAAVVLEVVLTLCHSNSLNEYVGEIAQLANALFETRGEDIRLSPRTVGDVLRRELGLVGRRRALGYQLVLDVAVQRRLHRLGMSHGVLQRVAGCPRCQEMPVANAI